jgi:hypothetical protein
LEVDVASEGGEHGGGICATHAGSRIDAVDGNLMAFACLFGEMPPTMPPIMPRFPSIPFPGCSQMMICQFGGPSFFAKVVF